MDEPEKVAWNIFRNIHRREKERYIGFPESFFVCINSIMKVWLAGRCAGKTSGHAGMLNITADADTSG
jgi:hypothetical protein